MGICLEPMSDDEQLITLPCGHEFHPECIQMWHSAIGDDVARICSVCRDNPDNRDLLFRKISRTRIRNVLKGVTFTSLFLIWIIRGGRSGFVTAGILPLALFDAMMIMLMVDVFVQDWQVLILPLPASRSH